MTGLLCALPLAGVLFGACAAPGPLATGYVEGEYTELAPVASAQVRALEVARGARVEPGQVLVEMEKRDAEIALSQAHAALSQAESELADLKEGKRPEEIRAIEASLASARAQAEEARRTETRMINLAQRGAVTESERDDAETAARVAEASVAQIEAELAVAKLPARPQEIAAAEAARDGAEAARDLAQWDLDQRDLSVPFAGTVDDIIRRPGEIAGPSSPVLTLLGDEAVKLRLYVPETDIARIRVGDRLRVGCTGCATGIEAEITYISNEVEFTPPVIYSLENRQKLVYLVEARPLQGAGLKPGQIVDVRLPEAGE